MSAPSPNSPDREPPFDPYNPPGRFLGSSWIEWAVQGVLWLILLLPLVPILLRR